MPDFGKVFLGASAEGELLTVLTTVFVIFYLYVLVRWQYVKRPCCFLAGSLGIVAVLAGRFFAVGNDPSCGVVIVMRVLNMIGLLVAFAGAVGACYGGKLPICDAKIGPPPQQGQ